MNRGALLCGAMGLAPLSAVHAQAPATVGDTVWLVRHIAAAPGSTIKAADWDPPEPIERLGPPRIIPHGDSAEVSYAVVVWRTGPLTVDVPGPVVQSPDGAIDSLPAQTVQLTISSVLPALTADTLPPPQPRADVVLRASTSWLPLLAMLAVSAVLLLPLHWWWRRRGPPGSGAGGPTSRPPDPPLEAWSDAGELRAVAAAATARLRRQIADRLPAAHPGLDTEALLRATTARDDWPLAELADLMRALDEARFGDSAFPDAIGLARWADELGPRLTAPLPAAVT